MTNNGLDTIPDDAQEIILTYSNLDDTLKPKLVELWHLFKQFHDPLLNHKYKPIDKYIIAQEDQAEGEFTLFVIQISYISDKLTAVAKEIENVTI
jgi:hypothetical protein